MFGFSLQKLLVLAAIVGAVWYGFKLVSRLQEARRLEAEADAGERRKAAKRGPSGAKDAAAKAEDMVQCPVCRTYVAARSAGSCGRPDCPY
jgi:uncharacterized protein